MFSAINIAASGLAAAGAKLQVSAENVVNAESDGYTARRVDLVELSGRSGVAVAGVRDTGRPVDLATEVVEQKRAAQLYTANAVVLRVADQMLGTVLDVVDRDHVSRRGGVRERGHLGNGL